MTIHDGGNDRGRDELAAGAGGDLARFGEDDRRQTWRLIEWLIELLARLGFWRQAAEAQVLAEDAGRRDEERQSRVQAVRWRAEERRRRYEKAAETRDPLELLRVSAKWREEARADLGLLDPRGEVIDIGPADRIRPLAGKGRESSCR